MSVAGLKGHSRMLAWAASASAAWVLEAELAY